jgi:tRNA A-37 threonylcarbamoyl transferase component Bud32
MPGNADDVSIHHQSGIKAIRTFKDSNLSEAELDSLVRQLSDETFEAGREVFTKDARTVPALYLVRKGRVKLVKKGGKEDIVSAGGYFGQDYFSVKSVGSRDAVSNKVKAQYSATTMEETVCSVLTVEECMAVFGIKIAAEDKVKPRYIPITDLTRHRILGEGLFGTVWLVTNKKARKLEPYALKIQMTEESHRPVMIKQEIKMMRALRYPFIVDVVATYEDENTISMLLSLAPGGELFDIIHRQDHEGEWVSGIGEGSAKFYAAVIADTIAFMHRQKFVFRDLKPENVLIDKDGYPVITDFGFSKFDAESVLDCYWIIFSEYSLMHFLSCSQPKKWKTKRLHSAVHPTTLLPR